MLLRAASASVAIALAVALEGCGGAAGPTPPIDKATYVPPQTELMAPGPLGERVMGKSTAPVTVIEYVSLTCPHCAQFQKELFPRMKKEFIDTGKVRYIVREFPIGRTAGTAAIVNRCAPEDKYFFLLNQFLTRQPEWVSQEVRPEAIYAVAKASGMSRETFDKCLSNQTIIDGLTEVKQRGRQFGVIGTPTFFINGRKAQGVVTYDQIKAMIEQAPPQSS
ncbi:MAG TPA: DsbA family protein [Methyloceanibacter sp.]|jgi:protein-disulfide isomerase|nr:DsbA family protein [Methyloceanibacter sp.]